MKTIVAVAALLITVEVAGAEIATPDGSKVRVWSDAGWERAERRAADGTLVWFALLRPSDANRPLRAVVEGPTVRVTTETSCASPTPRRATSRTARARATS